MLHANDQMKPVYQTSATLREMPGSGELQQDFSINPSTTPELASLSSLPSPISPCYHCSPDVYFLSEFSS